MAYSKTNWQDLPNTTTPINATRLNNIETGIENNDKRLNGTSPAGEMIVNSIRSKNMFNFNYEVTDTSVTHIVTNNTIIQTNAGAYARSSWKIPNLTIGKTYNFSCNYTNSNSCSIRLSIFNSTNTTLITETSATTSTSGNFSLTFTATETSIYIRFGTNTTSSANTNSVTFSNIQLEEGSTATTYYPYQNLDTGGVILYEGKSNTGITLSDNASNYNYLEIYYSNNAGGLNGSTRFKPYESIRTTLQLTNLSTTSTNQNAQCFYKIISISGTSLTVDFNRGVYMSSALTDYSTATVTLSSDNLIYIRRIVGYK